DDDRAAIVDVRHLRVRLQRKRAMRCGGGNGVEDLAAGRPLAYEVVPRGFPEKSNSSYAQRAITRVWGAAAGVCRGLDGVAWGIGCALFWRLIHSAGGCHPTGQGNTDQS